VPTLGYGNVGDIIWQHGFVPGGARPVQ